MAETGNLPHVDVQVRVNRLHYSRLPVGTQPGDEYVRTMAAVAAAEEAGDVLRRLPGYAPAPTVALPSLARALELGSVLVKDEGARFGLGAFKASGAAYAVSRLIRTVVRERTGRTPSIEELLAGVHAAVTQDTTLVCASAGNHGRAVAWAARLFHCQCRVYLSDSVAHSRAQAIRAEGAVVVRVAADYDACVLRAARDAAEHGWFVVSDTAWTGYEDIPIDVMRGYTLIIDELPASAKPPSHVFVQAGVGGLAAAVTAAFAARYGERAPAIVTVEPATAACVTSSIVRGERVTVPDAHSVMGGLACGVVSTAAWHILRHGAAAGVTVPDAAIEPVMDWLAAGPLGDPALDAGPSGSSGIAALIGSASHAGHRDALALDAESRVLAFITECGAARGAPPPP